MRPPKKPQAHQPPKIGDYVARRHQAHGPFNYVAYVALKTDTLSEQRISACATFEGATRLAKLLNDARDLAVLWRDIETGPLFKDGDPEAWARAKIAHALCKAIGVEAAHDFGAPQAAHLTNRREAC